MKKTMRTMIITLIAVMVLSMASITANAATAAKVTKITVKEASVELVEGAAKKISYGYSYKYSKPTAGSFTWKSSNTKVATVSGGVVTAKKAGTATITVSANGVSATCKVTVTNTDKAYTMLNNYRKNSKLSALTRDKALEKVALTRAKEMATTGKFSHTRPNGKSGLSLIKDETGRTVRGENIAKGQKNCTEVSKAWYASTGHRENMLRSNFKRVGIACYTYNGVTYWAQVFSN